MQVDYEKNKEIVRLGRSWGKTILILLAASLLLAANSIYVADRLVEISLNQEYIHFISIREEGDISEPVYNDGVFRKDIKDAAACGVLSAKQKFPDGYYPVYEERKS